MTRTQTQELAQLEKGYQSIGLDKCQLSRMEHLRMVNRSEVEQLVEKLQRGLARNATRV